MVLAHLSPEEIHDHRRDEALARGPNQRRVLEHGKMTTFISAQRGEMFPNVSPRDAVITFESFWKQEHARLLRFTQSHIDCELNAEDIVSEASYQLLKQWSTLGEVRENAERLRRYTYGVVKHTISAHKRQAARCTSVDSTDAVWQTTPEEAFTSVHTTRIDLGDALFTLPEPQSLALVLNALGMDSKEIAASTGARDSTVRGRIATARQAVRELDKPEPAALNQAKTTAQHPPRIARERRGRYRALQILLESLIAVAVIVGAVRLPSISPLPFNSNFPLDLFLWITSGSDGPQDSGPSDTSRTRMPTVETRPSTSPGPIDDATSSDNIEHEKGPANPPPTSVNPHIRPSGFDGLPQVVGAATGVLGEVVADVDRVVHPVQSHVSAVVTPVVQLICADVTRTGRVLAGILDAGEGTNNGTTADDQCK